MTAHKYYNLTERGIWTEQGLIRPLTERVLEETDEVLFFVSQNRLVQQRDEPAETVFEETVVEAEPEPEPEVLAENTPNPISKNKTRKQ